MFIKQLIRYVKYEYTNGRPNLYYVNQALKYYYDKQEKQETDRNRILLSQFKTNNNYSRMSLYNDTDFELAMILWRKDSQTYLHKHDTDCGFLVLQGQLLETKFVNGLLSNTNTYNPSNIGNVLEGEYHNIMNITEEKSLSLHIYDNSNNSEFNYELLAV